MERAIKLPRISFLIRSSIQRLASFSSNSAANPRSPHFSTEEDKDVGGGTSVYQYALRRQRPSTIKWQPQLNNSVSLIGSVIWPLTCFSTKDDRVGGYTYIEVINSGNPDRTFRIEVYMWDDIAKMAAEHLKKNDIIYVSGRLLSYTARDDLLHYQIKVNELAYVAQPFKLPSVSKHEESHCITSEKLKELQSEDGENVGDAVMETSDGHLLSWQLFFCKPYEWWDYRKSKQNSSAPDFKHKYTGECLWLRPDDPPWIQKQLQSFDSETTNQRQANNIAKTSTDVCKNRHHLWHVFFRNPHEWWDNRKNKKHPRSPDFKHKDTGEALWIEPNDPPWVKSQLQVFDSKMEEQWTWKDGASSSRVSQWLPDD